jgi:hypothetical protein
LVPSLPALIDRHAFEVRRGEHVFGPFRGWFQSVRTMARPFYLVPADADYVLYIRKEALGTFRLRPNDRIHRIGTGEQFIVMGHPEDPSGEGWLFEVYLQFVPAMEG